MTDKAIEDGTAGDNHMGAVEGDTPVRYAAGE